ncbi:MAG: hypothetical protein K1X35_06405 [Caulobacteraceae bacterium]|nr:hypothetical protein [Caulobacteraceae bacterium]
MRLSLVGLNVLALAAMLGASWLVFQSTEQFAPVEEIGRQVLLGVFGFGALALLAATVQFSGKRRIHAWGAITPMVVGFLLLGGGFAWLVFNATLPR